MKFLSAAIVIAFLAVTATGFAQSKELTPYSIIAVEYAGVSQDSPFISVLMSDSEAGAQWYRPMVRNHELLFGVDVHVVNSSLLKNLIASVDAFENSGERLRKGAIVRVSLVTSGGTDSFFYGAKEAVSLLESMQKTCSEDKSLCGALGRFEAGLWWLR